MKEIRAIGWIFILAGVLWWAIDRYVHTGFDGSRFTYDPEDVIERDLMELVNGQSGP